MAQTDASDYGFRHDSAQAGQKAGLDFDHVESYAAEGAVGFGLGLEYGTDPEKQVAVPSDDTGTFAGVSVFSHKQVQGIDLTATENELYSTGSEYRDGDTVNVLRRGRVWVEVTDAVTANATAYVDVTSATADYGKFTDVATSNVQAGVFRTDASTGELAILEINLP